MDKDKDKELEPKFTFDDWQVLLIQVHDDFGKAEPYQHVYAFVKNNQSMTKNDFMETQAAIRDILTAKSVNFGILMFMQGTYVFTQEPVDLNAVMIKLSDGINFNGEITNIVEALNYVNAKLTRG